MGGMRYVEAERLLSCICYNRPNPQGSIEKKISANNRPGSSLMTVKETALTTSHLLSTHKRVLYVILYQDNRDSYDATSQNFFARMVNSFHFVE